MPVNEAVETEIWDATVVGNREVARDIFLIDLQLGEDASTPDPGQFYLFDCGGGREHLLRRPFSVHGANRGNGGALVLSFLVEVVGWGTSALRRTLAGSMVNVMGPLGKGFDIPVFGRSLIVAGGMGIAPIYFLMVRMDAEKLAYDLVAGFKGAHGICAPLGEVGGDVQICTEDGSMGKQGTVLQTVEDLVREKEYSSGVACGPEAMMSVVSRVMKNRGIPCQVSLESRMACGLGVCRGCVKEGTEGKSICVCTDGPVFDSLEVNWRT